MIRVEVTDRHLPTGNQGHLGVVGDEGHGEGGRMGRNKATGVEGVAEVVNPLPGRACVVAVL
jgi:hypothetical protein